MTKQIQIVILAGGQGKRMKSDLPKVLIPFKGKPMIKYLLDSVRKSGVCKQPVIVVGKKAELVKRELGSDYIYIFQPKQLGTGHAVACTKKYLQGNADIIFILYGDQPFVKASTIKRLVEAHQRQNKVLTMAVAKVKDYNDWRAPLYQFGRIIRNKQDKIKKIVELKDCTKEQEKITEVNPSFFCSKANWLWQNINKLKNNNAQREYYLTDLVAMAIKQGREIAEVLIGPKEALGINTKEQLEAAENILN
jgi:bifunctional UDP-N-acetylglucosamine pyrophosphorylase/glucosamine-1-phosphate N-acetyltransferase